MCENLVFWFFNAFVYYITFLNKTNTILFEKSGNEKKKKNIVFINVDQNKLNILPKKIGLSVLGGAPMNTLKLFCQNICECSWKICFLLFQDVCAQNHGGCVKIVFFVN